MYPDIVTAGRTKASCSRNDESVFAILCKSMINGFHKIYQQLQGNQAWNILTTAKQIYTNCKTDINQPPHSSSAGRRTLRSSAHGNWVVPFACSATMQTRSFSVVGPKTRDGLQ